MVDRAALRKKYPKWAHRHAYHKKKRRRSRSRSRRRRRRARAVVPSAPSTNVLLMQLLHQILGGVAVRPLARKHGENVVTGYAGAVTPDRLAPVRSRDEYARRAIVGEYGPWRGVAAGAAAHAGGAPPLPG